MGGHTQIEKGQAFRALHNRDGAFIIPNPWDAGSARILAYLGFEALATTSMGYAFSTGRTDGSLSRDETLRHAAELVHATELPVSADLENGFGDAPETAAETIRLAAEAGLVGGSIEDATGRPETPIYEFQLAVERVRAAAEAAHALPFSFTLTARAENFLHGRSDLRDAIARLQAFQEAGADVLYAPALPDLASIAEVVRSVDRPVNVVMGLRGARSTVAELSSLGVKRISVGSALARAAIGAAMRAAREMKQRGTFEFAADAANTAELTAIFRQASIEPRS